MTRLFVAVCCYSILFTVAFAAALTLRFDFEWTDYCSTVFVSALPFVISLKLGVVLFAREWRRRLRYSSIHDIAWSFAVCLSSGILLAALQLLHEAVPKIPRSVLAIDTLLSGALVSSLRLVAYFLRTQFQQRGNQRRADALVYSPTDDGFSLVSAVRNGSHRLRVIGVITENRGHSGGMVSGVPVYSARGGIGKVIQRTGARHVLLPSQLSGRKLRQIADEIRLARAEAHIIPGVDEITEGRFRLQMRDITIDDLLRREPNRLDTDEIRSTVADKVVLVTGAAGSIGSEVCRQLMEFGPSRLILLDQSEFGIFELQQEFRRRFAEHPLLKRTEFILEDIADEAAMARVFMSYRPSVVFHAAAYKHVPLMEDNPQAAVRNNVIGSRTLIDIADRTNVERFVMISTDKAVRPTNVMGATKLLAEQYLHRKAAESSTRFITVRFGNVLNSAGSVVPTFRRQIEQGGPVTVTHPEMQRYFMTIPEAVQLVLQASAVGQGGDVLILDMGEPVRIVDLARDMITLSGLSCPDDIEIRFTGLRPGEKLYEELFYESEQSACRVHEKILRAPRQVAQDDSFLQSLKTLESEIYGPREHLRELLWHLVSQVVEEASAPIPRRDAA